MTRSDAESLSQVIGEIASELQCEPDNEAILGAISDLRQDYLRRHKDAADRGVEVLQLRETVFSQSAEIARLREALGKIASVGTIAPEPWGSALNKCPKLARAALEPKGDEA